MVKGPMDGEEFSIRTRRLSYRYRNASRLAIENIDLEIRRGELVLVVGPSGAGKSTLIYCLSGIVPHYILGGEMSGDVFVHGINSRETELCELTKRVVVVLQNPESQIFGMTVEEDVAFGLENLCLPTDVIARRLDETLRFLELDEFRESPPESLSGGQKQRLALGSVLALEPDVILFDEPLSNLDPHGSELVISTLKKLKDSGKTVILVERKTEDILQFLDRVIAIEGGKKVADCSPRELFKDRELVRRLRISVPQVIRLSYELAARGLVPDDMPISASEFIARWHEAHP